jgi:drug/metabolite transporter (DMT)-like permease
VLEGISCSLWQSLFVLLQSRERTNLTDVLHNYKGAAATTGVGIYLTYGLVLVSMNFVNNVSYVATFRQLSIPIGALFGMVLLREPRYNPKIIAVAMIFIGLILVGLG